MKNVRPDKVLRLTMLMHDMGKPDTMEIDKALAEFKETQKIKFKDSVMFKDFNLPVITSAEILPLYK